MCSSMSSAGMFLHHCVLDSHGGLKMASDSLGLELQMDVSGHVDAP